MINTRFSAFFGAVLFATPIVAGAAYPVYQNPNGINGVGQVVTPNMVVQGRATVPTVVTQYGVPVAAAPQYTANQVVVANTAVAASPTRVTGALPRVGSNVTAAGRQYYQPADYDRLADSGLYIGLSAGYAMSVMGGIEAQYKNEEEGAYVPGSWEQGNFDRDTIIPLQISVGAAINNDIRVDFSYTRYGGIAYPSTVRISDGDGGVLDAGATGGAVTANVTMLNVYYNVDSYTGYLAGGSLRPYIGAGVGLSLNTIADYVIYDQSFYSVIEPDYAAPGQLTAISDVYGYHNGGTTENLAFMLEGGVTADMGGGLKLDFFVRYANVGKVKTSGSIILTQTEWLGDGAAGEYPGDYDSVYHYTNWYESGRLGMVDIGVRLRLQF